MSQNEEDVLHEVEKLIEDKIREPLAAQKLTKQILKGAMEGLEIEDSYSSWLSRLKYQFIWLDKNDYSRALVRALRLAIVFAGTDFGSSRQRDMGQVWTDTARGFLGEIALSIFLEEKFNIKTRLDTRRGNLKDFLPTDIAEIKVPNEEWRQPNLKISAKTTKFNGRWLDVPGAQFNHSDIFVLVKIGILRQHFLAFLKAISFLKDKLFVVAQNLGELSEDDAQELWKEIPEFEPIPAYIAGYLNKKEINLPIHMIKVRPKGEKKRRLVISQGIGLFSPENLRELPEIKSIDPEGSMVIEVEPIIDSLTAAHFFAHSGGLKYNEESWFSLINKL